jgi:hypothetical protein
MLRDKANELEIKVRQPVVWSWWLWVVAGWLAGCACAAVEHTQSSRVTPPPLPPANRGLPPCLCPCCPAPFEQMDKEVNSLKAAMEQSKNDTVKYVLGLMLALMTAGLGAARLLMH